MESIVQIDKTKTRPFALTKTIHLCWYEIKQSRNESVAVYRGQSVIVLTLEGMRVGAHFDPPPPPSSIFREKKRAILPIAKSFLKTVL